MFVFIIPMTPLHCVNDEVSRKVMDLYRLAGTNSMSCFVENPSPADQTVQERYLGLVQFDTLYKLGRCFAKIGGSCLCPSKSRLEKYWYLIKAPNRPYCRGRGMLVLDAQLKRPNKLVLMPQQGRLFAKALPSDALIFPKPY